MATQDTFVELTRAEMAVERPTLSLLRSESAPFALAVFRTCFGQQQKQIACEHLHARVDGVRRDFVDVCYELPAHDGRAQCRLWVTKKWLARVPAEDGEEAYELTSNALEALRLLDTLASEHAQISGSRIQTIVDRIRVCALQASDDPSQRIDRLDEEISGLNYELALREAERDRIKDGGPVVPVDPQRMREEYDNVVGLLSQLPRDSRRIEESIAALRRDIQAEFRAELKSKGEVLGYYLQRINNLLLETAEGKAFHGALDVLQDTRVKEGTLPHIRIGKSVRVPAAALEAYLTRLEREASAPPSRELARQSIRVEVESRLVGFVERTGTSPAEFIAEWQAHSIPDTAENAELAMDALALRNVLEHSLRVA